MKKIFNLWSLLLMLVLVAVMLPIIDKPASAETINVNVTEPEIGATPSEPYSATYSGADMAYLEIFNYQWYRFEGSKRVEMGKNEPFKLGNKYRLYVTVRAVAYRTQGMSMDVFNVYHTTEFCVNKKRGSFEPNALATVSTAHCTGYYDYVFPESINSVSINIIEPVVGASPASPTINTPGAGISTANWYKYDNGYVELGKNELFKAGNEYRLALTVTPNEVHKFLDNTQLNINGKVVTPSSRKSNSISYLYDYKLTSPLVVTSQPKDVSTYSATEATFSVAVSGGTAPYTYEWYKKTSSGLVVMRDGAGVSGAKTDTLKVICNTDRNGDRYYCFIQDADGNYVNSDTATLTMAQRGRYTHADIIVQEPMVGQIAGYTFNLKSNDSYGKSYLVWVEADQPFTDITYTSDGVKKTYYRDGASLTFKADKYYACYINIDQNDEGTLGFDSSYTATVNGKNATEIEDDWTYVFVDYYFGKAGGANTPGIVPTTPETPGTPTTPTTPTTPAKGDTIIIKLTIDSPIIDINGVKSYIDSTGTKPVIRNSRTLLPVRAVVEAMGGTVGWDGEQRVVTMTIGSDTLKMQIGNDVMWDNHGKTIKIDTAPTIINNRTMLPIRFVAEYFGASVGWNNATREVTVTYKA